MEGPGGGVPAIPGQGCNFLAPYFPPSQVMHPSVLLASSRETSLTASPGLSGFPGTGRPHFLSPWPKFRMALPSGAGLPCQASAVGSPAQEALPLLRRLSGLKTLLGLHPSLWVATPGPGSPLGTLR